MLMIHRLFVGHLSLDGFCYYPYITAFFHYLDPVLLLLLLLRITGLKLNPLQHIISYQEPNSLSQL